MSPALQPSSPARLTHSPVYLAVALGGQLPTARGPERLSDFSPRHIRWAGELRFEPEALAVQAQSVTRMLEGLPGSPPQTGCSGLTVARQQMLCGVGTCPPRLPPQPPPPRGHSAVLCTCLARHVAVQGTRSHTGTSSPGDQCGLALRLLAPLLRSPWHRDSQEGAGLPVPESFLANGIVPLSSLGLDLLRSAAREPQQRLLGRPRPFPQGLSSEPNRG